MKNLNLLIAIEESINKRRSPNKSAYQLSVVCKISSEISAAIERRMKAAENEESFYSLVEFYIRRLKNDKYVKKNGEINCAAFYRDAFIDKTTWSNMKYAVGGFEKETLLKLIFALRLSESEANHLLGKVSSSLEESDPRDMVILALIDIQCYDVYEVYEVLEYYGKNGRNKFKNIYEMKE